MSTPSSRPRVAWPALLGAFVLATAVLAVRDAPEGRRQNPEGRRQKDPPAAGALPCALCLLPSGFCLLPPLLADANDREKGGWSITGWLGNLNNRTRIIQFCTVVMCLALFILMRKVHPCPDAERGTRNAEAKAKDGT